MLKLHRKFDYIKILFVSILKYRLKYRLTIADCYLMINTRRINAVPLFKRKVSSFLTDGGRDVLANTEEGISKHREKYGILPSFDNYSGIECHAFICFLSDISSSPVFRHKNSARAIFPVRSHWRGQCSIMYSINIKSPFLDSRNDALLQL